MHFMGGEHVRVKKSTAVSGSYATKRSVCSIPETRETVLDKLERMGLTDLRKHIVTEDEWIPEDIQKKYYSNRGAIYGIVSDRRINKGFKAPQKSEKYSNLYFVGGSVNPGGGMPMVFLSGQQVRDKIVNEHRST
jgi:diapolycopene oxygenase